MRIKLFYLHLQNWFEIRFFALHTSMYAQQKKSRLSTLLNWWVVIVVVVVAAAASSGRCPATRARAGRASSFAPIAALGRLILISLLIITLKSTKVRVLTLRRPLPRGWLQHLVNEAVSHGLVRRQIEISLHVLPTLLGRLTGHFGQLHVEIVVHLLYILYLQRNVGGLSLEGTFHTNPLEEETRIRQGAATALGTSASEKGAHARAQSNVDGGNLAVIADLAKEIIDSQTRAEEGAGNVEVQGDGTSGILLPQVQDGRND